MSANEANTQKPQKKRRWLRWLGYLLGPFLVLLLVIWGYIWMSPRHTTPPVETLSSLVPKAASAKKRLRVMTLNVAHGRQESLHQAFVGTSTIRKNLRRIARVLRREAADIVALQEADGKSWWSGNFHHVRFLAKEARYPYVVFGPLINLTGIKYGTALLSRVPLRNARMLRFNRGFPMFGKGFVIASINLPWLHKKPIDIISLHLDPPRASMRVHQLRELKAYLKKRGNPAIVVGDFNTEWPGRQQELMQFAKSLQLRSFQPHNQRLKSFPFLNKRLDWILLPPSLRFQRHKHLKDPISDHQAVVADIIRGRSFPSSTRRGLRGQRSSSR